MDEKIISSLKEQFPPNNGQNDIPDKPKPNVVKGSLVAKKNSPGKRLLNAFFAGDPKDAGNYILHEKLIPAMQNALYDIISGGFWRLIFGAGASERKYNGVPQASWRENFNGYSQSRSQFASRAQRRPVRAIEQDILFATREDAEEVLAFMNEYIDKYGAVSQADLCEKAGLPSEYTDNNWGWDYLDGAAVRHVRNGYILDLPKAISLK